MAENQSASNLSTIAQIGGGPIGAALLYLATRSGEAAFAAALFGWSIGNFVAWNWQRDSAGDKDKVALALCILCAVGGIFYLVISS